MAEKMVALTLLFTLSLWFSHVDDDEECLDANAVCCACMAREDDEDCCPDPL